MQTLSSVRRWWRDVAWGRHRVLVLGAGALAAVLVVLIGYATILVTRIERIDVDLPGSRPGGTTILIVGTDSRAGVGQSKAERKEFGTIRGERADVALLLRVPDHGAPLVAAVPRDLLVLGVRGEQLDLVRFALTWLAGPQMTVDALCDSLGIGVDRLAVVDFAGFDDLVDAVGGVDVPVPDAPLRDQYSGFNVVYPGVAHLDGRGALRYVRSRHLERFVGTEIDPKWEPVPNRRGEQARIVLEQVGEQLQLSPLHPLRTNAILWTATAVVRVDDDAGIGDLRALASDVRAVSDAKEVELPVTEGEGAIPFAKLEPGAGETLRRMGAGGSRCDARLPEARIGSRAVQRTEINGLATPSISDPFAIDESGVLGDSRWGR